ncbi:MAG: CAP domain-containing protein [Bacteroidia bacterium]
MMKYISLILICLGISVSSSAITAQDTINPRKFSNITFEKALFDKVNSYRKANSMKPYLFNQLIHNAAYDHAIYLGRTGKLTHEQDNLKTKTVYDRVRRHIHSSRFVVGENLARTVILKPSMNYNSQGKASLSTAMTYEEAATYVFNAWKKSDFHNKNMLSGKYSISAIAVHFNPEESSVTSVQVFAHFG